ncbi:MAG: PD40 domain-containing protein [Phycisphaerae bacterium]|nr:PD40 domain-containing protein [Phycisphaerae bacterium]
MKAAKNSLILACVVVAACGTSATAADFLFGKITNVGAPVNLGPRYSTSGDGEVDPTISQDELTLYFASSRPGRLGGGDLWMMTRASKDDPWSEPVNLGTGVNTTADEWAPKLSPDGLAIYFQSNRSGGKGSTDIWVTTRTALDAPWQAPVNLGAPINTTASEQDPTISADGLTLYFDRGQTTLYEARRDSVSTSWDKAQVVESSLNSEGNDCHPYISPDGLSIWFCSNRAGGYGAMDIYVATRASLQNPWGQPVNAGDVINSPYGNYAPCLSADGLTLYYDESATIRIAKRASPSDPWVEPLGLTSNDTWTSISADGLTIYFASDRAGGCGYQDLWMATRSSTTEPWRDPVNLGPNVNSNDWDWAPCVSLDGLELYFTSEHNCVGNDWNIYVCTRATTDDPWGPATSLGTGVNSPSPDGNTTLSGDKLTLIFSSERSGGDLWMARRTAVGDPWSTAVKLGAPINTSGYEAGPSLSPDGKWLFYTSITPSNAGTYNYIMVSALGADGRWRTPRNLAKEINLPSNAGCPTISPDGYTLYFTSDNPEGLGGSDLWCLDVIPIVDLNGDGKADDQDVLVVTKYLGQNEPTCDMAPTLWGDGVVDACDIAMVEMYVGMEFIDPTLLAHWALDETEGGTAHENVQGRDGTVYGAATWQPTGGMIGGALQLSGEANFVLAPYIQDPCDGPLSIFAWVKGGAPGQVIVAQQDGANWLMADAVGGALATELRHVGRLANSPLVSEAVITDGNWHRVGFAWDGVSRTLFVDDVEVAGDPQENLASSTGKLLLGVSAKMAPGTFWSGLIDDVRIYNRAVKP